MRRLVLFALCLALASVLAPPPARAAVPVVVVDGRGWGHGVGMAQDGAYWMAMDGASMDQILDHFYRGTGRGSHTGPVRVVVLVSGDGRATLELPEGGEIRSPRSGPQHRGFPVRVPSGGSVTVVQSGTGYRVEGGSVSAASASRTQLVDLPGGSTTSSTSTSSTTSTTSLLGGLTTTTTTSPSTTTTAPGSGGGGGGGEQPAPGSGGGPTSPESVWAGPVSAGGTVAVPARGIRYRGEIEVAAAGGPLRVINEVDIEQYLWGLAEVGASYPPAALQAQVVAARTYALRAMAANGEICDTQRCQVYKGVNGEFAGQVAAVNATLGTTLEFGGRYASAVFSANAAGFSATPQEGFGTSNESHPYLVATPYDTRSPDPWQVRIGLADLAKRLGYPGAATTARVATTGPSGRALEVEIDGDRGPMRYSAHDADSAMGLRSTMWEMRIELADAAPEAPEAVALIQTPPDEVGAAIAAETEIAVRASTSSDRAAGGATTTLVAAASTGDDRRGAGGAAWLLVVPIVLAGLYGAVELRRHQARSGTGADD